MPRTIPNSKSIRTIAWRERPASRSLRFFCVKNARLFRHAWKAPRQLILEKQKLNCFSNPYLAPLLAELNADRYVVYGVVTEICVRLCAFGLLKTGKRVEMVTDAVKALNEVTATNMYMQFTAAGGHLTTATALGM